METDYLIVGSGMTGATLARRLRDAGKEVLVVERRDHCGGNVFDHLHESGVRIHTYGPHLFRTSSEQIWRYVNRFAGFYDYHHAVVTYVDGRYEDWPVQAEYIRRAVGENWRPDFTGEPSNFEEACLGMMPRAVYERFVKGYTEKQWGKACVELAPSLAGRFEVRRDGDRRLKQSTYQGLPRDGYAAFMTRMLDGIPLLLGFDFLKDRTAVKTRRTVYTGSIDEFFGFDLGRLVYRGQRREHRYFPEIEWGLPGAVVNYPVPEHGPHIRTIEWKRMLPPGAAAKLAGTVLTTETPYSPSDPNGYEYPFPDAANQALYRCYAERAGELGDVIFCGRLGEYRYLDMDQAIGRAMRLADRLIAADA